MLYTIMTATSLEPVVYQSVCNMLSFEMWAKRIYLRPSYHIGLDWKDNLFRISVSPVGLFD